jgi:hypothetical protein
VRHRGEPLWPGAGETRHGPWPQGAAGRGRARGHPRGAGRTREALSCVLGPPRRVVRGRACGESGPRHASLQDAGRGADTPGGRCQRLGGSSRGAPPPRRGQHRLPRLRMWVAASVRAPPRIPWCQGTCLLAFCEGMRESRGGGRRCVCVHERQCTCGCEDMGESLACCGVPMRHPRVPVPAFSDSSLPSVNSITASRTLYL